MGWVCRGKYVWKKSWGEGASKGGDSRLPHLSMSSYIGLQGKDKSSGTSPGLPFSILHVTCGIKGNSSRLLVLFGKGRKKAKTARRGEKRENKTSKWEGWAAGRVHREG